MHAWAVALLTVALCLWASVLLENYFHPANLVMVFLGGVAYVAARHPLPVALSTVLASLLVYDLIFIEPRWSLKPTDPQNWLALVIMLGVGVLISRLAAHGREQAAAALRRERRAQALKDFALVLSRSRSAEVIAEELRSALRQSAGLEGRVVLESDASPDVGASPLVLPLKAESGPIGAVVLKSLTGAAADEDLELARALVQQAALALERARFEQRSGEAAMEAERERLRNTLLAGLSHDFRTPLTTIVGNATTLLLQGAMLDEARRSALLEDLLSEAQLLSKLTGNLLELTRLEEGAVRACPEWCHADELVAEVVTSLRLRLARHEVDVEVDEEALVWCDPTLVTLVLGNLLDNAARHSPPGGRIRVRVEVEPAQWRLSVLDEGPGVPPEQRQALFRNFHRSRQDGAAAGRGLGLAICAAAARLLGGRVELVDLGRATGACFALTLPQPPQPARSAWSEGEGS